MVEHVTLEARLEGDTAVDLGNDLRCDVVARVIAQINEADLDDSLSRLVDRLRCSTTADPDEMLTATFFHDQLYPKFLAAVQRVVIQADYLRLLDDPIHHGELQTRFGVEAGAFLDGCGFTAITHEIRFRPVDPGILAAEQEITRKWIEQVKAQARLEADKQRELLAIKEEDKRKAAEQAAETERKLKEIELRKKQTERAYEAQLHKLELEMERQKNEKEIAAGEIRRERDEYFLKRQEENAAYEQKRKMQELQDREALRRHEENDTRDRDKARLQHENEMRQAKLATLQSDLQIAQSQLATTKLEAEAEAVRGMAQAQVTGARVKAEHAMLGDQLAASERSLQSLLEHLSTLTAAMPTDDHTSRTIIQIGRDVDSDMVSGRFGVLGLLLLPLLRDLSQKLPTYLERAVSPGAVSKAPPRATDRKVEQAVTGKADAEG